MLSPPRVLDFGEYVLNVCFTPNSKNLVCQLAVGNKPRRDPVIAIRDLPEGAVVQNLPMGHPFALSSDGGILAVPNGDYSFTWDFQFLSFTKRRINLYRTEETVELPVRQLPRARHFHEFSSLLFLSGDRYLAGIGFTDEEGINDRLYLWDLSSDNRPLVFRKARSCSDIFCSPTGLVTTLTNQDLRSNLPTCLRFWQSVKDATETIIGWKEQSRRYGHHGSTWAGTYSPDEETFAAIGTDRHRRHSEILMPYYQLSLWSMKDFTRRNIPIIGKCYCIAISPDSRFIAAMTGPKAYHRPWGREEDQLPEYQLTLWNLRTGEEIASAQTPSRTTKGDYHVPNRMCYSPDGKIIAVVHSRHIELWDVSGI